MSGSYWLSPWDWLPSGLNFWYPVPLQILAPLLRTCVMPSSPTWSKARTPGHPPVLHWNLQGRGGMMWGGLLQQPLSCQEPISGKIMDEK